MQYRADSLGLTDTVTTILRDLVHERLGLMYEPRQFDQLADRLSRLVVERGLTSFMDYYYVLKYSSQPEDWLNVMDALAVNETYFWREIDQLRALVTLVVPELVEARPFEPLRIWSAPCATGEEPLTIAMLLAEAGWFDRAAIQIVASDASPAAIARARRGLFGQRSFRALPADLREKYFTEEDGAWRVSPDVQRRVSYDIVNLMSDDVARYASAPVIVCRNVFIYFSDQSIRRVLGVFEQRMPTPGYLCVGAAESLLRRTSVFSLEEIGGAFMYVKKQPARMTPGEHAVERAS